MRKDSECWVYFDFSKDCDNECTVAAIIMDKKTALAPKYKRVKSIDIDRGDNQFSIAIKALNNAIELYLEVGLTSKVNLQHQNKVVMDWLSRGYANFNYDDIFSEMYENFKRMYINSGKEVYIGHIGAKQNLAKKYCKVEHINKPKQEQPLNKIIIIDEELEETEYITEKKVINLSDYKL